MAQRHILMGDVIGSSKHDSRKLRKVFMELVSSCNKNLKHDIISPYTVTLGDEFQGIATSLHAVMKARKILTDKSRGEPRFRFDLPDAYTTNQLNRLFLILDGLTGRWKTGDGLLIFDMLANPHNEKVGAMHGKNRTQIWKRRRHLLIEEYRALKEAIMELGQQM